MASLTIDDLEDGLLERLRSRADSHGTSVEEEAAAVIESALGHPSKSYGQQLLDAVDAAFGPLGGVELDIPPRYANREPPRFKDW